MLRLEPSLTSDSDDPHSVRLARVMSALDEVLDPELDESVTTMGFVEAVILSGRTAEITFRLPTFWCSANFAYLMASDMREAVERLAFVDEARVRLVDHFAARKINRGVAAGRNFVAAFAGEAQGDLGEIRRLFHDRAFLGRQERLLELLAERSWSVEAMLALSMNDLDGLAGHHDPAIRGAAARYLAMRRREDAPAVARGPAFITLAGEPVRPETYAAHRRDARRIHSTAAANAEMCRIQLQARIAHPAPGCETWRREVDDNDE